MAMTYESARQMAESLSREDQLRLIQDLMANTEASGGSASVLELQGLGAEIWQGIDAREYVNQERSSWNG